MATKVKLIADNAITAAMIDTTATPTFGGITVNGDATVTGDLNITGNLNSYNVTDLDVTDQTITLGAGQTEALSGGSGIIVDGSGASILWDETNDTFDFNKGLTALGNVGIGTDSPSANLHVSGGNATIYVQDSNNTISQTGLVSSISGYDSASTKAWLFGRKFGSTALYIEQEESSSIIFNQGGSEIVRFDSSGNVGIGTTSPSTRLHAYSAGTRQGQFEASGSGESGITIANSDGSGELIMGGVEHFLLRNLTQGKDLILSTTPSGGSVTEAMRILSDGNVGIGIDVPTSPLHVYHTATVGLSVERDGSGVSRILVKNSDGSGHIEIGAAEAIVIGNNTENKDIYFETTPTGGSVTERARIHANGGLSIDTTNVPASTTGALVLSNGGSSGPSTTQPGGGLWIENASGTPQLTLYRASGDALRLDAQGSNNLHFDNISAYGYVFYNTTASGSTFSINYDGDGKVLTTLPIEATAANDHFKSGVFYNVGENPINNPWHTCTQVNASGASGGTADCGECVDTTGTITGCSQGTGSAYNWYSAKRYCELAGMRLCTRAEVIAGAGTGSGCQHNNRGQWTSTKGTTDSTKYFIVQGDGNGSSATAEQENYPYDTQITGFTTNEIGIRCCQQNSWS